MVLFARSQQSLLSLPARRVHVVSQSAVFVFSATGFKGSGKPYQKTIETAALRKCIQQAWVLGGD